MTETQIQQWIVRWLEAALPAGSIWHHSPNEGRRHISFKKRLALMGTRWGWPDLEIFVPAHGFHKPDYAAPIFIEVKAGRRGRATSQQVKTQKSLQLSGCFVGEARSIEEAEAFLTPLIVLNLSGRARSIKQLQEAGG
jgi:hypothetical protein